MLNQRNYKRLRTSGLAFPIKFANAHALREAGRLIYNADHRVKTDMRISMQQNTHEYRHNLHKRLREAQEKKEEKEQDQLHILEDYAAMVEGALNIDGIKPFGYAGLEMQEALTTIQTSLEKLEKGGEQSTKPASLRLTRLKTIVSLHEEKKDALASMKSMREWVLEGEHIFDGSWAKQPEEITNAEVGRRFDAYLARLSWFLAAEERTEDEKLRRGSSS